MIIEKNKTPGKLYRIRDGFGFRSIRDNINSSHGVLHLGTLQENEPFVLLKQLNKEVYSADSNIYKILTTQGIVGWITCFSTYLEKVAAEE
mgnify:CR=1 FL=1